MEYHPAVKDFMKMDGGKEGRGDGVLYYPGGGFVDSFVYNVEGGEIGTTSGNKWLESWCMFLCTW